MVPPSPALFQSADPGLKVFFRDIPADKVPERSLPSSQNTFVNTKYAADLLSLVYFPCVISFHSAL